MSSNTRGRPTLAYLDADRPAGVVVAEDGDALRVTVASRLDEQAELVTVWSVGPRALWRHLIGTERLPLPPLLDVTVSPMAVRVEMLRTDRITWRRRGQRYHGAQRETFVTPPSHVQALRPNRTGRGLWVEFTAGERDVKASLLTHRGKRLGQYVGRLLAAKLTEVRE